MNNEELTITARKYWHKTGTKLTVPVIKEILKNSFCVGQKEKYRDKIIDYKDSPTGEAYVGVNKSPFMKNDTGHGFKGVLLQDESRCFVQCSICGKWMKSISPAHLKTHDMKVEDYKDKFGFNAHGGLVSDNTSLRLSEVQKERISKDREKQTRLQKRAIAVKGPQKKKTQSLQHMNRYGTCPAQLKERLYEFVRINKMFPGPGNKGNRIYQTLRSRHGTFGQALVKNGFPYFYSKGSKHTYVAQSGEMYIYNAMRGLDKEELWDYLKRNVKDL